MSSLLPAFFWPEMADRLDAIYAEHARAAPAEWPAINDKVSALFREIAEAVHGPLPPDAMIVLTAAEVYRRAGRGTKTEARA